MTNDLDLSGIVIDSYSFSSGVVGLDTEYLITELDDCVVVSPRGSEVGIIDWITNFRCYPVNDEYCGRCHRGFLLQSRLLAERLSTELLHYNKKVVFAGHSLGAAISVLTAIYLTEKYNMEVDRVCVFGCPKPFVFSVPQYAFQIKSYVNSWDYVTKVPVFFTSVWTKKKLKGERGHIMSKYHNNMKLLFNEQNYASVP